LADFFLAGCLRLELSSAQVNTVALSSVKSATREVLCILETLFGENNNKGITVASSLTKSEPV